MNLHTDHIISYNFYIVNSFQKYFRRIILLSPNFRKTVRLLLSPYFAVFRNRQKQSTLSGALENIQLRLIILR